MVSEKIIVLVCSVLIFTPVYGADKTVIGWEEDILVGEADIPISAKIDTGTDMASLHCGCDYFRRDGHTWVRINLATKNRHQLIERPIERYVNIKRSNNTLQKRAVISLNVCLASVIHTIEVNLVDRSGMEHQFLLGRDFLNKNFLIDPGRKRLTTPKCRTN